MKRFENLSFFMLPLILIGLSFKFLEVPLYWDELWVYGPALQKMAVIGPTIFPGKLDAELARGHPLMFHFIGGLFIKGLGGDISSYRWLGLLISTGVLAMVWLTIKRLTNWYFALIISMLLLFQNIYRAQSLLALPEMLLTFFTVGAAYFYLIKRYWAMAAFLAMALLTKETGITIGFALGLCFLIENRSSILKGRLPSKIGIFFIPIIPFLLFLGFQFLIEGWAFFPEHVGYIDFSFNSIIRNLNRYFSNAHIYWGRNSLLAVIIISFVLFIVRKLTLNEIQKRYLLIWGIFGVVFLSFLSINFFSDRYVLAYIPFYLIGTGVLFFAMLPFHNKWVSIGLVFLIPIFTLSGSKSSISDHSLGFIDMAYTNQETVDYLDANFEKSIPIASHFVFANALSKIEAKHISTPFVNVNSNFGSMEELRVFTRMEGKEDYLKYKEDPNFKLIKRFEKGPAWTEIYQKIKP